MNHLPFALTAYFFNALSVLTNKFLLSRAIPRPLTYIFYVSLFSLTALLALPFANFPSGPVFILLSLSTISWTIGAFFMFSALKMGEVSRVVPVIGTLMPVFLLIFAASTKSVSQTQIFAVVLLILGMIFLTLPDLKKTFNKKELLFEIIAAFFFAVYYTLLRESFSNLDFFSGLVFSRVVLLPPVGLVLLLPYLRKKIINFKGQGINFFSKTGAVFIAGQASGIASELLLVFSVSLSIPALVNSLAGSQYIFLFIAALILSKKYPAFFREKYNLSLVFLKLAGIAFVGAGLFLVAMV